MIKRTRGEIIRKATESFGYVLLDEPKVVLPFDVALIEGYRGQTFGEYGLSQGAQVDLDWSPDERRIEVIRLLPRDGIRVRSFGEQTNPDIPNSSGPVNLINLEQKVLHPADLPRSEMRLNRAIPSETRSFGKLVNCAGLRPGDILMSWDLSDDNTSKMIVNVQEAGGYGRNHSRWSHVAIYLGDGENVVEATFESLIKLGSVRITSLDEYARPEYALRFRRLRHLGENEGWRLCIRALSRIRQPYDFLTAAGLWWDVVIRGRGFYDGSNRRTTCEATICSTLLADSYNEVTKRTLGEIGGACVPAWISLSDQFDDVEAGWARIFD
jgi:hypothetical protein